MGVSNTLIEASGPPPFDYRAPHGTLRMLCDSRRWNGITVRHVVQHLAPGRVWHDMSASQSTVAVVLEQVGGYCEPRINLNRPAPRGARYDAGHTVFVPADMTVWGYSDQIQLVRDLRLHFDSRHLESLLGEDLRRGSEADPVLLLYDDRVVQCASLLARECGPGGTGVRLFGEGITTALVALLFAQTRSDTRTRPAGLSGPQLKRVLDYFHAHLSSDVSLESVALLTGLSQSQFARAFRASMGVSPYRWFLNARVKHAQTLLLSGTLRLADIAVRLGFTDQSHFTKAFRRATATTPGEWRRGHRS